MRPPLRDLVAPAVAAVVCGLAVIVLPAGSAPRVAAGLVLVFLLPGAVLTRAVLQDAGVVERVVLWPALSIVGVTLITLLLEVVGVRLGTTSWLLALAGVSLLVGCLVLPETGQRSAPSRARRVRVAPAAAGVLGLAAVLTAAAVVLGTRPLPAPASTPGYTSLWAVPLPGTTDVVQVGVRSGEKVAEDYRLDVLADGRRLRSFRLRLAPGQSFSARVPVPGVAPTRVATTLFRAGDTRRPYRRTVITLRNPATPHAP